MHSRNCKKIGMKVSSKKRYTEITTSTGKHEIFTKSRAKTNRINIKHIEYLYNVWKNVWFAFNTSQIFDLYGHGAENLRDDSKTPRRAILFSVCERLPFAMLNV